MGFYYTERPPERGPGWKKYIPGWLKRFWAGTEEALIITRVAFGVIFPVMGVLFGVVLICFLGLSVLSKCTGASG